MSDQVQDYVYKTALVLFIAAVGVGVAFGVVGADTADHIVSTVVAVVAGVAGVGVSGLAKKHLRGTVTQQVVTLQDVFGWSHEPVESHVDRMERERARAESQAR